MNLGIKERDPTHRRVSPFSSPPTAPPPCTMTSSSPLPRFLSVTGEPLPQLDSAATILGRSLPPTSLPTLTNPTAGTCRPITSYKHLNRLGEGTYGVVHRSLDTTTSRVVALKQVRIFEADRGNGIPITALREISILRTLRHRNIVSVLDVAVGEGTGNWGAEDEGTEEDEDGERRRRQRGRGLEEVYMVMEYAEQVCYGGWD